MHLGEFSPPLCPLNPQAPLLLINPLLPLPRPPCEDDFYLYAQFPGVARPLQTGEKLFWLAVGSRTPVEAERGLIFLGGRT